MSKASAETLQKVAGEFEGEVLADLQEGREQALALIEDARRETRDEVHRILETSVKQSDALKRQIVGAAELEARNTQLMVLEKAVNEAVAEAVAGVPKLERKRYETALGRLISEGVDVIGQEARVLCNERDKSAVASALRVIGKHHPGLTEGAANLESSGGVVLTTSDGTVRFDNTLEARLERMRATLRKEVVDLLSG